MTSASSGTSTVLSVVPSPLGAQAEHVVLDERVDRSPADVVAGIQGLDAELLAVVDQTMQPTQASLWLRAPAATRPSP